MHNVDYTSIFIPKRVTVVIKPGNSAYIVDSDNPKTLHSAELWATYNYCGQSGEIEKLEYINDGFRLKVLSAAGKSSQSGKLSFWTCEITAPDGKTFNVGVNSELICELIQSSCFISGKCQEDLKFGTRNNQWGFFCESMPAYKEYVKSQDIRNELANNNTTKYKAGDIVRSLTEAKLYIGEMYKYFDIECNNGANFYPWQDNSIGDTKIVIYKTPKKLYTFATSWKEGEYEIWPDTGMLKKKPKRLLTGATFDVESVKSKFYDELKINHDEYIKQRVRWRPYLLLSDLMYGEEPALSEERLESVKSRVSECVKYLVQHGHVYWNTSANSVTYVIE